MESPLALSTSRWIESSIGAFALIRRNSTPDNVKDVVAYAAPDLSSGIVLQQSWKDVGNQRDSSYVVAVRTTISILLQGITELWRLVAEPDPFFEIRAICSVQPQVYETLYPFCGSYAWVSELFLNEASRDDVKLKEALRISNQTASHRGITHHDNSRDMRGGYSLYVPENYNPRTQCPLIVSLHGAGGHGYGHVWTWIRDARSNGVVVLCPTSISMTWGLSEPESDIENILSQVEEVGRNWNIDRDRLLLQGISDGGSFALATGLMEDSVFTHLVPCFPSFHPMFIEMSTYERLQSVRIYLIHGALDWMFPIETARETYHALLHAGVDIEFREIADLSHSYPDDENVNILRWYLD